MSTPQQGMLRTIVRGTYDIQQLRIQTGNRLVGNFKVKLGIEPGTKEKDLSDTKKKKLLDILRIQYERITDGVIKLNPGGDGVISTQTEMNLVKDYLALRHQEDSQFKSMALAVSECQLWQHFLKGVRGIGPAIAGVILSEFDIAKAKYPSSLHAYAGLDVATDPKRCLVADGKGRNRQKNHLVVVKYTDRNGKPAERNSITFNPFLKTKLIGVLGPSFLKSKSPYAVIYYNEKHRLENHPNHKDKTAGHRHAMSIRKMVKIFLIDLYVAWRTMENLPVSPPFHEAKLGMKHAAI